MLNMVQYNIYKVVGKIIRKYPTNMNYFFQRKQANVADDARIFANILTSEPFLISIGRNTTIASNVKFVTHDASIGKVIDGTTDLFGKIKIGNSCFIGAHSVILYGVEIADNCIVAAGSVVTKSFLEKGIIIGGNPAKKIGSVEQFKVQKEKNAVNRKAYKNINDLKEMLLKENKLVIR